MAFFLPLDALSQTTEWLKESIDKELFSETDVAPGAEHSSTPSLSPLTVLNNCYLKLLQWDYQKNVLPEVSGFVHPPVGVQCGILVCDFESDGLSCCTCTLTKIRLK